MIKRWAVGVISGMALILLVLPLVVPLGNLADILILLFLYIILGQSFNVLAGYTGLVSLGHATFFGAGSLATRFLWVYGAPFYVAILAGGFAAAVVSALIGVPCLRLRGAYFAMGTLALAIIGYHITSNIFITESFLPGPLMANYSVTLRYYVALAAAVAVTIGVYMLANSRAGMGMVAVREDEEAARSLGVSAFRSKLKALLISAFIAGIAGGVYAFYQVALYYYHGFSPMWSFEPIFVTFLGGPGTVLGPILGSAFYVILREVFAYTIGAPHVVIFGVIFMIIVLVFPQGLATVWEKLFSFLNSGRGSCKQDQNLRQK
jgi:branched-chain amino acid transport system permease protein